MDRIIKIERWGKLFKFTIDQDDDDLIGVALFHKGECLGEVWIAPNIETAMENLLEQEDPEYEAKHGRDEDAEQRFDTDPDRIELRNEILENCKLRPGWDEEDENVK